MSPDRRPAGDKDAYVRALEAAEFIVGPSRSRGIVVWAAAGLFAVGQLVKAFEALVAAKFTPAFAEHEFLVDQLAYRSVFGDYDNVYEIDPATPGLGGKMLRPDNIVSTVAALRESGSTDPCIAVGGLMRELKAKAAPLFRDRYIWPAVELSQRICPGSGPAVLDFYRTVLEELLALAGLPAITVRTTALAEYGQMTYLVVSVLPGNRPTVLATLYILNDKLRCSLGDNLDIVDVGFTGKLIATCAMLHRDARGLSLPSVLAPVQLAVTTAASTDMATLAGWLAALKAEGIRTGLRKASTPASRNRAERRWHALGVPLVIGIDRSRRGDVIRATRMPLTRTVLPGLPEPSAVRTWLACHDAYLLRSGQRRMESCLAEGNYLQSLCGPCAGSVPVFGQVVPRQQAPCGSCGASSGSLLFVSKEGRFY